MRDKVHWPVCPACTDGHTYTILSDDDDRPEMRRWLAQYGEERHTYCEGDCLCENFGHQRYRVRNRRENLQEGLTAWDGSV